MRRSRAAGGFLCAVWLLSILSMLLSGCTAAAPETITSIRQLDGKAIGVITGSSFDLHTDNLIQDADKQYYDRVPDLALALEQGRSPAF